MPARAGSRGPRTTAPAELHPWQRIWVKLAIFGVLGVVVTHAVHLIIANRVTTEATTEQMVQSGQLLARLLARQAAGAILTENRIALQDLVDAVSSTRSVAYCFIQRGDEVLASSYPDGTPTALVKLRHRATPVVVNNGEERLLDLSQPVRRGTRSQVRIGLLLSVLDPVRRRLSMSLGLVALGVIGLGVVAAALVGRRVARPLGEMLHALQRLDPSRAPPSLALAGRDEIGALTEQVNDMCQRLHRAHREQQAARHRQGQTEKLAALGSLVAGIAHEVNNPLAGLKNCQRRLLRDDLAPERRAEYLALIDHGLSRIEQVMERLINFARPRKPRRAETSLAAIARAAVALLQPAAHGRQVQINDYLDDTVWVSADAAQIEQVVTNLLLNAIQAAPVGGRVWLASRRREGSELAGIAVCDDGPGIPPEIRGQIEDPFFTTKPEGEGTGLGLSVSRTIADAHGGDLTFEAAAGGGTQATLWLPVGVAPRG